MLKKFKTKKLFLATTATLTILTSILILLQVKANNENIDETNLKIDLEDLTIIYLGEEFINNKSSIKVQFLQNLIRLEILYIT